MPKPPDVSINPSLALKNGEDINLYILSSCHHLQVFHQCLAMVIQAVVGCRPILFESVWDDVDCIFYPPTQAL